MTRIAVKARAFIPYKYWLHTTVEQQLIQILSP
jgi:hypothetical protein